MSENFTPNSEGLPVVQRVIAACIVFSSDNKVLLGRKHPKGGGVFVESWHLPGGGTEPGESLAQCAARELQEEAPGLPATEVAALQPLPWLQGHGGGTKTLPQGRVWCEMEFHYFRLASAHSAATLLRTVRPSSDFAELHFFTPQELAALPTVPGGVEARITSGQLTATSGPISR